MYRWLIIVGAQLLIGDLIMKNMNELHDDAVYIYLCISPVVLLKGSLGFEFFVECIVMVNHDCQLDRIEQHLGN